MADVVVTLKIMPSSVEVDMDELFNKAKEIIVDYTGIDNLKKEIEPVAFGLKALKIYFVMAEDKGSTDKLEDQISEISEVESVKVIDVRRSIG
ncbi:elongation factor 1-beta [Candidatus Woesearchaeota archaeon]|nr:elongation factor 1-beta [Candidatus Woesearchaeota archaeon]